LGRTIEPDEIVGLPLVNRNVYSELSLTPGVMANNMSPTANPSGSPGFTIGLPTTDVQINGSIDGGNPEVAFYLDGGNNITGMRNYGNPAPNPDALEEFRVETSAFSAQYGQFSSAVVTVITKSGTTSFMADCLSSTATPTSTPIPGVRHIKNPYHRNQFGGNFGGPIKHDKAFFFFSYAGLRQVQGAAHGRCGAHGCRAPGRLYRGHLQGQHAGHQDAGGRNKQQPQLPGCHAELHSLRPAGPDRSNFDNTSNKIGVFHPVAQPVLSCHRAEAGITLGDYVTPTEENEYLGKYDQVLGDKDHLTVGYFFIRACQAPNGGGNIPWTINQSAANQTNANISEVHTFSPSTANQTWLTFTRAAGGRVNLPEFGPSTQTLASYGSELPHPGTERTAHFSAGNFSATTTNAGPFTGSDNYELRDVVSMTKGKHSLFLGGEFALDKTMFWADLLNFGDISFATSAPTSTGNQMSDWVTGQISAFEQDTPYVTHLSTWHIAVFLQDNYRITPRFTANLGIRWDIDTPPVDAHNRTASFVPGQQSTIKSNRADGHDVPGDTGVGRGIISAPVLPCFAANRLRVGPVWGRQDRDSRRRGHLLRHHQRQRVEPARQRRTVRHSQTFGPQPSLTNIYGGPADNFLNTVLAEVSSRTPIRPAARNSSRTPHRSHQHRNEISLHLPVQP
jgi:hypothetical protein